MEFILGGFVVSYTKDFKLVFSLIKFKLVNQISLA